MKNLFKKLNNYPSILVFNERKIIDLLSPSKNSELSIAKVRDFLKGL
jgi:hypothetical protein